MNNNMCNGEKHVVKEGDTLYKISRMYNVPLDSILKANQNIEIYNLQPGQVMCIPMEMNNGMMNNGMMNNGMMNNGMMNTRPMTPNMYYSYIIKDNDTLEKLLSDYNLELDDLMRMNPDGIPLKNGVSLYIPEMGKR